MQLTCINRANGKWIAHLSANFGCKNFQFSVVLFSELADSIMIVEVLQTQKHNNANNR
jgi:hypothetical protein